MHRLTVLVLGSNNFYITLNELKSFLKFNIINADIDPSKIDEKKIILCHGTYLSDKNNLNNLKKSKCIKILVSEKNEKNINFFHSVLKLPTSVSEINNVIERSVARDKFGKNSFIKVKNYILDKNEKKLNNDGIFLILTEKEVQLLELFLKNKKPINKNEILFSVWQYASDADTHTVETHIYRLRKKIKDKFSDENFILNNKEGYYL
tara:strand:- start:1433 stop:2053 length:621 start_codon:yes stop_codon:yes gene_type:complete